MNERESLSFMKMKVIPYIKVTFIFISMLIFLKVKGIVRYYSFHFQKTG